MRRRIRRLRRASIGFGQAPVPANSADVLRAVTTRDFIDYGLEPEFIGRLPIRVVCDELSAEDLFAILKTSEGSVIRQYGRAFEAFGIEAHFHDEALREIAVLAAEEKTGARGLVTVCLLPDFPSTITVPPFDLPYSAEYELRFSLNSSMPSMIG